MKNVKKDVVEIINSCEVARPFRNEVHHVAKQSDLPQRPLEEF
ncbi:hypothetical protein FACS189472_11460 [Alphaproteobacteria bacterium]|nr:hypothetical protein FACS189472_11460 [Alphaproteobacteria bacterium]